MSVSVQDHEIMKDIALRKALAQQKRAAEAAKARAARRAQKGKGKIKTLGYKNPTDARKNKEVARRQKRRVSN